MYITDMGPRGRRNGHGGFRPDIFLGLIGLFLFGWIIIAVIGGMLGAGAMVLGSVFRGLMRTVSRLFTGTAGGSVAAGIIIGLL